MEKYRATVVNQREYLVFLFPLPYSIENIGLSKHYFIIIKQKCLIYKVKIINKFRA